MSDLELEPNHLARVSRLFEALDAQGRMALLRTSQKRVYPDGAVICREGEPGEEFFVIARGDVRVSADDFGTQKELAVLSTGQFFGEMAALGGHVRNASAVAIGEVELVVFPIAAVNEVLQSHPAAREILAKVGLLRSEQTMQKLSES
jgi:CRP-like cAMP-binding protein